AQQALARLVPMLAGLRQVSNQVIQTDFYLALAEAQADSGNYHASEQTLEKALFLAEEQRSSIGSEVDRKIWARDWFEPYKSLVEVKLNQRDFAGALGAWEIFR